MLEVAKQAETRTGVDAFSVRASGWTALCTMSAVLLITAVLAIACRPSYWLTCVADGLSCVFWALAVGAMLRAGLLNHGRVRIFWIAFAAGAALASMNLGAWAWYDLVLRQAPPNPFWADIPLFLQPVPMMAAVALQPHRRRESPKVYLGTLNFLILLLWWVYLYSFRIFPHEYVNFSPEEFNRYYNVLYIFEFLILLASLGWSWTSTTGRWRSLYLQLFLACVAYTLAFQALNSALLNGAYAPGSMYDVFDNLATCWFIWIAIRFARLGNERETDVAISLRWSAIWSVLAALAVLSVPAVGIWTLFQVNEAPALHEFRLAVTLVASAALAICVFLRQRVMDRRLIGLLAKSEQTLDRLQRVQVELVHKERLGSLGQLVAGAAHEINNPLTAILGYSELLGSSPTASSQQVSLSNNIAQQARYARNLVSDLLTFARTPVAEKSVIDIASLLQRAVQMENGNPDRRNVEIIAKLSTPVPRVFASTHELFQACVQLIGSVAAGLETAGGGTLLVRTRVEQTDVVVEFSCLGRGGQPLPPGVSPCAQAASKDSGLRSRAVHEAIEKLGGHIVSHDGSHVLLMVPAAVQSAVSAGSAV